MTVWIVCCSGEGKALLPSSLLPSRVSVVCVFEQGGKAQATHMQANTLSRIQVRSFPDTVCVMEYLMGSHESMTASLADECTLT